MVNDYFVAEFYRYGEPLTILNVPELSAAAYLSRQIRKSVGLYIAGAFPVLLLYGLIHTDQWWLSVIFLILSLLNVVLFVVTKYAVYKPQKACNNGQVVITLSALGILLPVFFPMTLFFIIRNYFRSLHTLKPYLYAYN